MITRSPRTPCEDKQSESLCKHLASLGVIMINEASPSCMMRWSTVDGNVFIRSKTFLYCSSLHTCASDRSALMCLASRNHTTWSHDRRTCNLAWAPKQLGRWALGMNVMGRARMVLGHQWWPIWKREIDHLCHQQYLLRRCQLCGWSDNSIYEPLIKHWNRRKKKYPLDPILCEEQLSDFLYSYFGNASLLENWWMLPVIGIWQ